MEGHTKLRGEDMPGWAAGLAIAMPLLTVALLASRIHVAIRASLGTGRTGWVRATWLWLRLQRPFAAEQAAERWLAAELEGTAKRQPPARSGAATASGGPGSLPAALPWREIGPLLRQHVAWQRIRVQVRLGTGDAAQTAVVASALQSALSAGLAVAATWLGARERQLHGRVCADFARPVAMAQVDAACSASLYAVLLAMWSLWRARRRLRQRPPPGPAAAG